MTFILSYFRTEAEALHLATSEDGLHWRALNGNRPVLEGTVGTRTLRDPFLFRAEDGVYHLLSTDGWYSRSIVHATSEDLVRWSEQELLPVMESIPEARNAWAPECFFERETERYRLIWSSALAAPGGENDWNHRIWSVTTPDFRSFSPPEVFFDPGYSVIDATVRWWDERRCYLMAFKDERGSNEAPPAPGVPWKAMRVVTAPRATGPRTGSEQFVTPDRTEGPTLFRHNGRWVMLFDFFCEDRYGAVTSEDGVRWDPVDDRRLSFPPGPRHASVLPIEEAAGRMLQEQFG